MNTACWSVLRSRDEAADATQEVFLRAADSLKDSSSAENARSWLLTEARNYCHDVLRQRQRLARSALTLAVESGGDADPEAAAIDRHVVTTIFGELRKHERRALWQWAVERRPLAEIAHDQRRSYKAVQQFLFRARRHALSVAARLAALLGLLQLGRAARRLSYASQFAAVVVVVPMVLATMPSSSAPNDAFATPAQQSAPLGQAPTAVVKGLDGTGTSAAGGTLAAPGVRVSLPPVLVKVDTWAVEGPITTLERTVRQLRQTIGSGPVPKGGPAVNVGLPRTPEPSSLLH